MTPRACIACREPISIEARLCPHCATQQHTSRWSGAGEVLKWAAGVVTASSLAMGVLTLSNLYNDWQSTNQTVAGLVETARLLDESGRYEQAWALYDDALALSPGSALARHAQVGTAMTWLRNAEIRGEQTFAEVVEPLIAVLYRGLAAQEDAATGDILAHLGWAYYLEARDRDMAGRRDAFDSPRVVPLFERAVAADRDNVYAHAMWGFWEVVSGEPIEEARVRFEIALAAADARADTAQHDYARRLQRNAVRFLVARPSGITDERRRAAADELLRVANAMRVSGEPRLDEDARYQLFNHYGRMGGAAHVEEVLGVLPADEHLATFEWLFADMYPAAAERTIADPRADQRRYLHARLIEENGDPARALDLYEELAEVADVREELAILTDEGIERISGRRTDRALAREGRKYFDDAMGSADDPWQFHTETLLEFDPAYGSTNAEQAIEFFSELAPAQRRERSLEILSLFERTRERVRAYIAERNEEVRQYGYTASYSIGHAEMAADWLHALWAVVGRFALEAGQTDRAIAELGDLAKRLDPVPDVVHYDLARAYSRRAARSANTARPAEGDGTAADKDAALGHLERATQTALMQGGAVSWVRIKDEPDFEPLREDPRYEMLLSGR